jgi:anaerobic ribonucleoside-triphosphate reductase-activating protein
VKRVKETFPNKNIWCYSGFTYEELLARENNEPAIKEVLEHIDVLVDGKFVLEKKNLKLAFRGSENQRLINIPETLKSNQVVLLENYN